VVSVVFLVYVQKVWFHGLKEVGSPRISFTGKIYHILSQEKF